MRHANGELKCEIPFIISNHTDLKYIADQFGIPFHHLPMEPERHGGDKAAAKAAQEARIEALVEKAGADTLVMARYMQVLSDGFCDRHAAHTINIHHSFLPAFEGAKLYHRAKERGVKLIGATAHYATAKLDMGPIIVQDVAPVSHRDTVKDMVRKGKDVERVALARALRHHLESRVLVHEGEDRRLRLKEAETRARLRVVLYRYLTPSVLFRKTKTRRTRASARCEVRVDRRVDHRVDPRSRAVTNAAFGNHFAIRQSLHKTSPSGRGR